MMNIKICIPDHSRSVWINETRFQAGVFGAGDPRPKILAALEEYKAGGCIKEVAWALKCSAPTAERIVRAAGLLRLKGGRQPRWA